MVAAVVFREKRAILNSQTGQLAIAEIRIWRIPRSLHYPEGRKFSLFLVCDGKTVVGMDNHRPKGPHLHLGEGETVYKYRGDERLVSDFWDLVRKGGFEP